MFMRLKSVHQILQRASHLQLRVPNNRLLTPATQLVAIHNQNVVWQRLFSGQTNENDAPAPPKRSLPSLMSFPEIIWPSVINTIKNWIYIHFIIMPYFDKEFNMIDFVKGAKQALQSVSNTISEGDLKLLNNLVTHDAIDTLKKSVSSLSVAQRHDLAVHADDIYFSFPYQIGIIFDETNENIQQRWVEITMVFHILKGLKDIQASGELPNITSNSTYKHKIFICNYRFIKEFTQGKETDWIINVVNHFKPAED